MKQKIDAIPKNRIETVPKEIQSRTKTDLKQRERNLFEGQDNYKEKDIISTLFPVLSELTDTKPGILTINKPGVHYHLWGYQITGIFASKSSNDIYRLLTALYFFPDITFEFKTFFDGNDQETAELYLLCSLKSLNECLDKFEKINNKLLGVLRLCTPRYKISTVDIFTLKGLTSKKYHHSVCFSRIPGNYDDGQGGKNCKSAKLLVNTKYYWKIARLMASLRKPSVFTIQFRPLGLSADLTSLYATVFERIAENDKNAFYDWSDFCQNITDPNIRYFIFQLEASFEDKNIEEDILEMVLDELSFHFKGLKGRVYSQPQSTPFEISIPPGIPELMSRMVSQNELAWLLYPMLETYDASLFGMNKNLILELSGKLPVSGNFIGIGMKKGAETPVFIEQKDRMHHTYIIGKSGSGKTTLIENMILQDIYAGKGAALIDPHGDIASSLLKKIPDNRIMDVVYFNPYEKNTFGIDIFSAVTDEQHDFTVSQFLQIMISMYGEELFGPRIQDYTRNFLWISYILKKLKGRSPSLFDVIEFLDYKYLSACLKDVDLRDYPMVKVFYKDIAMQGVDEKHEMIPYMRAKFSPFSDSHSMKNVFLNNRPSLNFNDIINNRKIFIANLSKGLISEFNSNLIGSFLVSKFWEAATQRAFISEANREPFHCYIDEFQNFVTGVFSTMLSEARKYGFALILANQYLSQLRKRKYDFEINTDEAIFGNVGNIIAMKVGVNDADLIAREFGYPVTPEMLIQQDNFTAIVKTMVNGTSAPPFTIKTVCNGIKLKRY